MSGSLVLKDAPKATDRSLPRRLAWKEGKVEFLTSRSRARIIDGVFYFEGILDEKAHWEFALSSKGDPNVYIEFDDPAGGIWSAKGAMEILKAGQARHPDLERALNN